MEEEAEQLLSQEASRCVQEWMFLSSSQLDDLQEGEGEGSPDEGVVESGRND